MHYLRGQKMLTHQNIFRINQSAFNEHTTKISILNYNNCQKPMKNELLILKEPKYIKFKNLNFLREKIYITREHTTKISFLVQVVNR